MPAPNNQPDPRYQWQRPTEASLPGFLGGQGATLFQPKQTPQFQCNPEVSGSHSTEIQKGIGQTNLAATAPSAVFPTQIETRASTTATSVIQTPPGTESVALLGDTISAQRTADNSTLDQPSQGRYENLGDAVRGDLVDSRTNLHEIEGIVPDISQAFLGMGGWLGGFRWWWWCGKLLKKYSKVSEKTKQRTVVYVFRRCTRTIVYDVNGTVVTDFVMILVAVSENGVRIYKRSSKSSDYFGPDTAQSSGEQIEVYNPCEVDNRFIQIVRCLEYSVITCNGANYVVPCDHEWKFDGDAPDYSYKQFGTGLIMDTPGTTHSIVTKFLKDRLVESVSQGLITNKDIPGIVANGIYEGKLGEWGPRSAVLNQEFYLFVYCDERLDGVYYWCSNLTMTWPCENDLIQTQIAPTAVSTPCAGGNAWTDWKDAQPLDPMWDAFAAANKKKGGKPINSYTGK